MLICSIEEKKKNESVTIQTSESNDFNVTLRAKCPRKELNIFQLEKHPLYDSSLCY